MPLPTWVRLGDVVETPSGDGFISQVGESEIVVTRFDAENTTSTIPRTELSSGRVRPHRWMQRIVQMASPFFVRVHYRNDSRIYEVRPGETPPAYIVAIDDRLVRRSIAGAPPTIHTVLRIRPREDRIMLTGLLDPMTRARIGEEFVRLDIPSVEEAYRRAGTFVEVYVLDVHGDPDHPAHMTITFQAPEGTLTRSLPEFNLEYESCAPSDPPTWVSVGSEILNLNTDREDVVTQYDPTTTRVHLRVGYVTLDTLLREWTPLATRPLGRREQNRVDTLWASVNPIALLRVVAQDGAVFDRAALSIEIVGSGATATLRGSDLRSRAVILPYRAMVMRRDNAPWGAWPVGSMWRLTDDRYVYVLQQAPGGTVIVSDSDVEDLDVPTLDEEDIESIDAFEGLDGEDLANALAAAGDHLEPVQNAQAISLVAPITLDSYRLDRIERARQARANDAEAEALVDPVGVGELRAWSDPPALVEVVAQTAVTVSVRIVPTSRVEEVPRSVFDTKTLLLNCRNTVSDDELPFSEGSILNSRRGPIGVGALLGDGSMTFYSVHPIDSEDLDSPVLGGPPETLGYEGIDTQDDPPSTLAVLVNKMQAEVPKPVVLVGQVWMIRFGPDIAPYVVRRIARDHDAIWVAPIDGNTGERPINSVDLLSQGTLHVDVTPEDEAHAGKDQWVESATRKRGFVMAYGDKGTRTVVFEWAANVTPRTVTIPVNDFLDRFRCLTAGGHEKALAVRNAPGQPMWARLRRPTTD